MKWLAPSTGQATFEGIKNTSLGKLVRDQLLNGILSGAYMPGQALRESELVEQLKVSRVPVREALRELESAGLVVSRKHSGVYVRELSDEEVKDLYQFRSLLDGHAGRMAAQLPDDEREELVRELDTCVTAMDTAISEGNAQGYYSLNLEFHWLFIEYAGNREIAKAYRDVIQKLHLARLKNLSNEAHRVRSNTEHRQIVDALRKVTSPKHAGEYADLLAKHVINAHDRLSVM
ncbi:GntR family transcriptional regulator [Bordetella sp. N]|uniref:GntR family transcriptional regulator n=1 Tax=Bordetella sp. N TaxID=1746199 RepID=UPI0007095380|nr:GntR family transcriptional regulator [Bordetella sp. N]ALM85672.1 GntR family transcriptional regulator [Bordetella sp. N]